MSASRMIIAVLAWTAASPLAVLAQGHEAEGGSGGLFDINVGLSMWTLLVFAGLVFILGKFAWGPILAAVDAREAAIQGSLDEAARRETEAKKLLEEHRQQLADARRQASELLAEGKAAGENVRKDIEEKARSEAQAIVERARAEIQRERDAALDALRKESVELALSAAARLMQEKMDEARDRQIVERFLDDVEADRSAGA